MENLNNPRSTIRLTNTMKTILEIFYLRVVGKNVRYQRKELNLSRKGGDPDRMIWSGIRDKRRGSSEEAEEQEFIVHSTSWRYARPDKVILTYVAYSDEMHFAQGRFKRLALKQLRILTKKTRTPRSRAELEKKVVSHAMRHLAFLIQTDDQNEFKNTLTPETIKVFERLWVSLAGEVLEE